MMSQLSILAACSIVATAAPAGAHGSAGQSATNWRSEVDSITVESSGVFATTTDLGDHIEVTTDGSHEIIVFGYSGEPYLKFNQQGVSINARSPAGFLNRSAVAPKKPPARFDATAPPEWQKRSSERSYRWHDHRFHRGANATQRSWSIPISVDGNSANIVGQLIYVDPDTPSTALLVGVLALGIFVAFAMLRPRAMAIVSGLLVAISSTAILVSQQLASTEPWQEQLGATSYSVAAILSAVAILAIALSTMRRIAAPVVLLASVALLVCGGFARFDWLTHSQLPTSLDHTIATVLVTLTMVIAAVLAVFAIIDLLKTTETPRREAA